MFLKSNVFIVMLFLITNFNKLNKIITTVLKIKNIIIKNETVKLHFTMS